MSEKQGLSSVVCVIPRLEEMNLLEMTEEILKQTKVGEYDIYIPLNLPNANVKALVFLPPLDSVMNVLSRLAESYGATVEVIEYEKLIKFKKIEYMNHPRSYS